MPLEKVQSNDDDWFRHPVGKWRPLTKEEAEQILLFWKKRNYEGYGFVSDLIDTIRYLHGERPEYEGDFLKPINDNLICCDDCNIPQFSGLEFITKGDHHGGNKTVCRDRESCHKREHVNDLSFKVI